MHKLLKPYFDSKKIIQKLDEMGKKGVRSSKATDVLNEGCIELLRDIIASDYRLESEYIIPCSRGDSFKVDIAIFDSCNQLVGAVLLKAVRSSYNKNRHNYGNTSCGEFARLFTFEGGVKSNFHVLMVDWIPHVIPVYDTRGNLKNNETTKPPDMAGFVRFVNESLINVNSSFSINKIQFNLDDPTFATGGEKINEFCSKFV
jgi:hypothetical protein